MALRKVPTALIYVNACQCFSRIYFEHKSNRKKEVNTPNLVLWLNPQPEPPSPALAIAIMTGNENRQAPFKSSRAQVSMAVSQ